MQPLRWSIAPDVELAFSSAADGDLRSPPLRGRWLGELGVVRRCVVPGQVHGTRVADADDARLDDADGLVSADPDVALGVFGADCPGVCLIAPDALGVAHCGWRGTAGGIVARLVAALSSVSASTPERWRAFIGPGIAGASYEVDSPVLTARVWPPAALSPTRSGHARLDLTEAIASDLAAEGIGALVRSGVCTHADERLHSYRWQGRGITQLLAAWRR
jgi:YfiH family protein